MKPLLQRAWRGLREHLYLHAVSAGVIATSLVLLGMFGLAASNLRLMLGTWERDAHVTAYFRDGVDEARRIAVREAVAARPEVATVRYVSEVEARTWLVERMDDIAPVLDELGPGALPTSLEVTLRADRTSASEITAFASSLEQSGEYEEVDFGQEWVARVSTFLSLLTALGTALGAVICVATVFLVGNTTHLVVHSRRDELEIMRLVGATEGFILGPFLVEGVVQGFAGGLLAVGGLYGLYRGLLVNAAQLVRVAVGDAGVRFLDPLTLLLLLGGGIALGLLASWITVTRALRKIP